MTRTQAACSVLFALALVATPVAGAVGASTGSATESLADSGATHASVGATAAEPCSYPLSLRDASGSTVEVSEEPERVVTLGPASAQTMWELDAQSKVVGVTQFAAYLDGATAKANVSGAGQTRISVEKVVAQDPDVVLAENVTDPETVSALRNAGVTVYYFNNSESVDDVYDKVASTGRLVGECDAAVESVRWMKEEMAIVQNATEGEEPRNFLYSLYGYTAGENTFIHSGLTAAGGNNLAVGVVEFPPSGYAPINPETVANLSVDWIVYPGTEAAIPKNAAWNQTTAVQEGNLVAVDRNQISQPAPRVALAVRHLAKTWYPESYEEANESLRGTVQVNADIYAHLETEPTATTSDDGDSTDDDAQTTGVAGTTTVTDDGATPGFGPVVALLAAAVLVVGALARRD
ncbi:ABC transporter substrate-binding protein [Halorubellus sp. JP-L1]|uniref:PGF-CTERM-anchored ABC transporter substrate-binding protein n=1 Tax=Halorubellus sp. JP-L1 TaxID=2715753 RepID=UPI0014086480|nr:PGF-CTERM-anchored ABC transporter substrate-binding protein [Halorubellus sp. JP-L1]NHN40342.1 ABC transporter substrate-binding protein [Halorubellus sp. JP-L1]